MVVLCIIKRPKIQNGTPFQPSVAILMQKRCGWKLPSRCRCNQDIKLKTKTWSWIFCTDIVNLYVFLACQTVFMGKYYCQGFCEKGLIDKKLSMSLRFGLSSVFIDQIKLFGWIPTQEQDLSWGQSNPIHKIVAPSSWLMHLISSKNVW